MKINTPRFTWHRIARGRCWLFREHVSPGFTVTYFIHRDGCGHWQIQDRQGNKIGHEKTLALAKASVELTWLCSDSAG